MRATRKGNAMSEPVIVDRQGAAREILAGSRIPGESTRAWVCHPTGPPDSGENSGDGPSPM